MTAANPISLDSHGTGTLIPQRLNIFNQDHAKFWREYKRNSDVVEPDAKFGRISKSKN